jgi:hypothetical protein
LQDLRFYRLDQVTVKARLARTASVLFIPIAGDRDQQHFRAYVSLPHPTRGEDV